jgi:putative phosphoesterase
MMRIGITSDIHTDFSPSNRQIVNHLVDVVKHADLDVLIICGDVSPNIYTFTRTLSAFHDIPCKKLFVAGNHDIWVGNDEMTSHHKYLLITKICDEIGFHHLGDSSFIIGEIGFCGTIGWYDYTYKSDKYNISDGSYEKKVFQGNVWNDVNFARWRLSDQEVTARFEADLQDQINNVRNEVSRIMVVTHHVPFKECVKYRDELPWDFFSAFMGSRGLGRICFNESLVTHAFFGHTHLEFFQNLL